MIRLLLADVLPLDDPAVYDALYEGASPERRALADAFRFAKDRRLSIGAAALLDKGLSAFGLREKDMSYGKTAYGKPFFVNAPDIHFNISHSGTKVAVALSDAEVGCDIEQAAEIGMDVAGRYFSPAEYEAVVSQDSEGARLREFYRYWTLKESYIKATGFGLSMPLKSFTVTVDASGNASVCGSPYSFLSMELPEGYHVALCYRPESGDPLISCLSFRGGGNV